MISATLKPTCAARTTAPKAVAALKLKSSFTPAARPLFTAAKKPCATTPSQRSRAVRMAPMALFGSAQATPKSLYDITIEGIDGKAINMANFKGKVLLVLNVASQCGFTPQYKDLVQLYSKYNKQGLEILGQPCNQFGGQEPGTNSEIKAFAQRQGANFTMAAKADVNGAQESPLFKYLKSQQGGLLGSDIKWNFSKFLVDKNGKVVKRYSSMVPPSAMEDDIKALL